MRIRNSFKMILPVIVELVLELFDSKLRIFFYCATSVFTQVFKLRWRWLGWVSTFSAILLSRGNIWIDGFLLLANAVQLNPSYPWVLHLWIRPIVDWKYSGKKTAQSSKKQILNLPCTEYYTESTWMKWSVGIILGIKSNLEMIQIIQDDVCRL